VYYAQAWSLVWDDKPLFRSRIEAWANGPAIPALYRHHRGEYSVSRWPWGDARNLEPEEKDTVASVLHFYGDKPAQWLVNLTHQEAPWRDARGSLPPGAPGYTEIRRDKMHEYYSSL